MEHLNDILARVDETSTRLSTNTKNLERMRDTLSFLDGGFMRNSLASMPYTGGICKSDRSAFVSSSVIRDAVNRITKIIESKKTILDDDSLHKVVYEAIDVLNGANCSEPEVTMPRRGRHIDPDNAARSDDFINSMMGNMSYALKSEVDDGIQKLLSPKHQLISDIVDDEYRASPITTAQRTCIYDAINSMKG